MKTSRKFVALSLIFCLLFTVGASAINGSKVQMRSSDSGDISSTTHYSNLNTKTGFYEYSASVIGFNGSSSAYVAIVIQQDVNGTWTNVPGSFRSDTETGSYAGADGSRMVMSGYWYRTQATYIINKNGKESKIVENSDQYWYA